MAEKNSIQYFDRERCFKSLVLPSDYVIMKKNFQKELIKFYLEKLGTDQKILDLNPGTKGIYNEIDLSRISYIALEQNPLVTAILNKNNVEVIDWDIPLIPLDDNSIDYALSTPFIEHLPTYIEAIKLLLELRRVLKPGGRVLIIVPNYLSLKEIFFEDYKHGWVTTKKRLMDMLLDCHYKICGCRYTIGWITMRRNFLTTSLRFVISIIMAILRLNFIERFLETIKLDTLSSKFKKTVFELIVIEAEVK
jgi:SAM-dependent methyltransferase